MHSPFSLFSHGESHFDLRNHELFLAKLLFEIRHRNAPWNIQDLLQDISDIHSYNIRSSVSNNFYTQSSQVNSGHVHRIQKFFFYKIFLWLRKFSHLYAAYLNHFQPSTHIRLYPEIFWFALVPSSFAGENPEMSRCIIAILVPFLLRGVNSRSLQFITWKNV